MSNEQWAMSNEQWAIGNWQVQDGACIHCTFQRYGTTIGNNVSIGHHAIVHGCTLHDNVLIGMGAIVMDNAVVNSNTIIAAGAVVLENTICEAGSIYAGVPAKKGKGYFPGIDQRGNQQDSKQLCAIRRLV